MSSLAAARADNFYYPPGWTPEQGSLNTYHGQHALRERARKLDQGILIIRFEMPFHVWCGGCGAMIAQGVRFNAEKKQIGNYYSTKIWSFKMKAACCQHEIEIQTDPKNCDYNVVSGAQKKVVEYDAEDAGTTALPTAEEREKLADPFFKVEHLGEDAKKAKSMKPELGRIKATADARHADPWRLNKLLRAELRGQKKRVSSEETEARSKGLGIRLLPASAADSKGAALAQFRPRFDEGRQDRRAAIRASSIFAAPSAQLASQPGRAEGAQGSSRAQPGGAHAPAAEADAGQKTGARHSGERGAPSEGYSGQKGSRHSSAHKGVKRVHSGAGQGLLGGTNRGAQAGAVQSREQKAQLAAKRRRIDARGVLEVAVGR